MRRLIYCSARIRHMLICLVAFFPCLLNINSYAAVLPRILRLPDASSYAAYTISGSVFNEFNENGIRDPGDAGINGVRVTAYDVMSTVATTTITSAVNGHDGTYQLTIPAEIGPTRVLFSNFGPTSTLPTLRDFQPSNHKGGTTIAFVAGTQPTNTVNLGIARPDEYCLHTSEIPTYSGNVQGVRGLVAVCQSAPIEIGDRVWNDVNGNGIQDPGEVGLPGVTVHLYAANGTSLLQSTVTDSAFC